MSEATPRPWKALSGMIVNQPKIICILGDELYVTANSSRGDSIADQNLIVRACNAHDTLVAACEAIAAHIDPDAPAPTTTRREAMLQLRAALALARGEK